MFGIFNFPTSARVLLKVLFKKLLFLGWVFKVLLNFDNVVKFKDLQVLDSEMVFV